MQFLDKNILLFEDNIMFVKVANKNFLKIVF